MTTRTMLITGGGIGIGRATSLAFARAGYRVIVTDVLPAEGAQVVAAIREQGGEAEFHHLDVRSTSQTEAVVGAVEAAYGPLETVIANAGIAHKVPLAQLTDEKWHHTFDIDLMGVFRVLRAAAPAMRQARRGSMILVSSIMGINYGWDEHAHYSSAKAGVIGLMRGLAVELARDGIRVNAIAPGYVRTAQPMSREHSLGPEGLDAAASFIPMGRVGDPSDIADVALFLASDGARYLTGQTLVVDGGLQVGRC